MLIRKLILLVSCILLTTSPAASDQIEISENQTIAIVHVNVIHMNGQTLLRDQTVIVAGGKIIRMGPSSSIRVPRAARRIDGRNKYLLPGLVDFHVHLRDESELLSYLIHGVTTVVHMSGPMGNVPDVVALRRKVEVGSVLGPNIYTTGRILDGEPPIFPRVSTVVPTPEQAERAVEEQYRAGVDFVKVYNNLSSEVLRAIVTAAHRRGLAVIGHIPRRDGRAQALQIALGARQDMIAHSEELFFTYFYGDTDERVKADLLPAPDRSQIPSVARWLKESGVAVTANLSFVAMTRRQLDDLDAVLSDPEFKYLHPAVREMWQTQNPTRRPNLNQFDLRERGKYPFLQELVAAMQAEGVPVLLGTDGSTPGMFPGKSAQVELQELVKAGLTPFHALSAGTRNAGKFIKQHIRGADSFGTVLSGQRADLLLLAANPLEDIDNISKIVGVMVRGRWLSHEALRQKRTAAIKSFNHRIRDISSVILPIRIAGSTRLTS